MTPYYNHAGITIYHGDCREILPTLPQVDLVLTDPPYGLGESRRRVMSRGRKAQPRDYGEFSWDQSVASTDNLRLALAAGHSSIIWGGNYFSLPPSSKWLVWNKLNAGDFADCELAWTNLKGAVRKFDFLWHGMIRGGRENGIPRVHPAQKPVALMKWCIVQASVARTIIDPFMGSGTSLIAAKEMGLSATGIDIDEISCEIAVKRLSQEVLPLSDNYLKTMGSVDEQIELPMEVTVS